MSTGDVLGRVRNPEYTGENRCVPCTVVNVAIALLCSAAVAVAGVGVGAPLPGAVLAAGLFGISAILIYLRGYLVPGTPALTKRYFPPWLLAAFGKAPPEAATGIGREDGGVEEGRDEGSAQDPNPETTLIAAGALEECADEDDLCLTDDFRTNWADEIERVTADEVGRERLLDLLDADGGEVTVEEFGEAFVARVDGQTVGKWESEAAYRADIGAAELLAWRVDGWEELPIGARSRLLNGLRIFLEDCPGCGADLEFGTDTVESCCSTHEVAAVSCPDCGARLFESSAI